MKNKYLLHVVCFCFYPFIGNASDCLLYFDGLNPTNGATPYVISTLASINRKTEHKEERLILIRRINQLGIDAYVANAIATGADDTITIFGNKHNLLDLSLIKGAKEETIIKLAQLGYMVSPHSLPLLHKKHNSSRFLEIVDTMTIDGLHSSMIEIKGISYSLSNFLLLNKDFTTLNHLKSKYDFDLVENFSLGQLIDIRLWSFEEKVKASNFIELASYNELFDEKKDENVLKRQKKSIFNNEYKIYQLKHNCPNAKDYTNFAIKYAVKGSDISNIIDKLDLDLNKASIKEVTASIESPIVQEYVLNKLYNENTAIDKKVKFDVTPVDYFDNYTSNELQELAEDTNTIYVDSQGLSLKEYLFLNGLYKWEPNTVGVSLNRLAYYLIKNEYDFSSPKNLKLLRLLEAEREKGKNLTFYLLYHTTNKDTLMSIYYNLPNAESDYGLNILEMLHIKQKLYSNLQNTIQVISEELSQTQRNRL